MSWTDKSALQTIKQLRDEFDIKYFIETGTFRGVNASVHSYNFPTVATCELVPEYFEFANKTHLHDKYNVFSFLKDSFSFLQMVKTLPHRKILYLDAHFYDPELPIEKRFTVKEELEALQGCEDCIIIIHDFDNGELGHIVYDGIPLNFEIVKDGLHKINPNFHYYTNTKEFCDIITKEDIDNETISGVIKTEDIYDAVEFVWTSDFKAHRGILYCSPTELDLSKYKLVELK